MQIIKINYLWCFLWPFLNFKLEFWPKIRFYFGTLLSVFTAYFSFSVELPTKKNILSKATQGSKNNVLISSMCPEELSPQQQTFLYILDPWLYLCVFWGIFGLCAPCSLVIHRRFHKFGDGKKGNLIVEKQMFVHCCVAVLLHCFVSWQQKEKGFD